MPISSSILSRRWVRAGLAVALLLAAGLGAWSLAKALSTCGSLDRLMGRSGCVALYRFGPDFAPVGIKSWPGLAFSPDGKTLAITGNDFKLEDSDSVPLQRPALLRIDPSSGSRIGLSGEGDYIRGIEGGRSVSWSGQFAAGLRIDDGKIGHLRLWRLSDMTLLWETPPFALTEQQPSLIFSGDETKLIVGALTFATADGKHRPTIDDYDPRTGWGARSATDISGHRRAKWDPATASVVITDPASKATLQTLAAGTSEAFQDRDPWLHFSRDGRRLIVMFAYQDKNTPALLLAYDVDTGRRLLQASHPDMNFWTAWTPDAHAIAVLLQARRWDEGSGVALFRVP
jgi:hypothetical protein